MTPAFGVLCQHSGCEEQETLGWASSCCPCSISVTSLRSPSLSFCDPLSQAAAPLKMGHFETFWALSSCSGTKGEHCSHTSMALSSHRCHIALFPCPTSHWAPTDTFGVPEVPRGTERGV